MPSYYPRDLKGYGDQPPNPNWPGGARVAVSIVVAVEAGAELSLADGDERNESVYEIIEPVEHVPNTGLSSHFAYGSRVGYWRIMRVLEQYGVPAAVTCSGRAIEKTPWIAQDIIKRGHEISAHSYRWEGHAEMEEMHEREVIQKTIAAIETACGQRPLGWHTKGTPSPVTRKLLAELGFVYDSDCFDDDLPRMQSVDGKELVIVPYAFDTNDMRFQGGPQGKFLTADHYAQVCIDAFDTLWEEGAERPAMMSIGVHPHYSGRPSRIRGLKKFLEHATAKGDVWFARRLDIARHWLAQFGA
ncbi:polysaccharide deacetylase family protein [Cerasicoccus fimbriatus]|uniref:polysaccharide deacetylase family protein n=1 Tax=Cerasicoccus fimbriatus TaxID=3014554 RepID=UPI0022B55D19|nr:polysaccharide deacetylase family protein [Cerasicoccus sp. TK19100]